MSFSKACILLVLFVLEGCGKNDPTAALAQGANLPGLVHAANAPIFDTAGNSYTELVLSNGIWKIHDNGNWQTAGWTENEIHTALKDVDHHRQILLSAEGNTAFADIRKAVRGAARAGFPRVDFLVSTGSGDGKNHAFFLKLGLTDGSEMPFKIEPFMISLDAEGSVFTGLGPSKRLMDTNPADHSLPKLNSQLELYTNAGKAAQCQPLCQVYADPAVNYQRVTDLFSRFHAHGLATIIFIDLNTHIETTCGGMGDGPRQHMNSQPLPSAPSDQPRAIGKMPR